MWIVPIATLLIAAAAYSIADGIIGRAEVSKTEPPKGLAGIRSKVGVGLWDLVKIAVGGLVGWFLRGSG